MLETFNMSIHELSKEAPARSTITILFLAANPTDTTRLKLGEESQAIDQALHQTEFREKFHLETYHAVRGGDLQSYLLRYKPDIVHFSSHGSSAGEIILQTGTGDCQPVSVEALSQLFKALRNDKIRCVVLNACYSERQAQEIAKYVDCVIGMSQAIGDKAAISFAVAFYQALGYGRDVRIAFDLGCAEIKLENLAEKDIPKLLCNRSDPAKIVFVEPIAPPPKPPEGNINRFAIGFIVIAIIVAALWKFDGNLWRTLFWPNPPTSPPVQAKDGDMWTNPVDRSEYVYVSEGEYIIGATEKDVRTALGNCEETGILCDASWYTSAQPISTVHLDGFWIKRTEVTNEEYGRCVSAKNCEPPFNEQWDRQTLANNPVTHITWHQAHQYAQWVEGRLPTEAEWEVACRGRSRWVYPWSNEPPDADKLNYKDRSGGRGETTPVGSYPAGASPYGVLDMLGNVQEWTNSLGGQKYPYPYDATDGRENPAAEGMRVVRGWSYAEDARLTCFTRGWLSPYLDRPGEIDEHRPKTGFRVVISGL